MRIERRLPPVADSVSVARKFVSDALPGIPRDELLQISLMVSELVTNSVVHTSSDIRISLNVFERSIRVEVADDGGGRPKLASPNVTDPHGRGLRIVDQLADNWGIDSVPNRPGKTVWFSSLVTDAASPTRIDRERGQSA